MPVSVCAWVHVCVWLLWWCSRAGWGLLASLHSSGGWETLKQPSEMGNLARKIKIQELLI